MKTLIKVLVCMLIMAAAVSTASASKESIQNTMDMLRSTAESSTYAAVGSDEASSYATSNSDEDSVSTLAISGVATIGDNTLAGAFSQGEGDDISLGSLIYLEGDTLNGEGEAYVTGDEANTGSSASAENGDGYNSISIEAIANGIGDASGYTWALGWE